MRVTINVVLPRDRTHLGTFTMVSDASEVLLGPVPCLGKSDNAAAIAAGNPTRDMLLKDGDHPLGLSRAVIVDAAPEAEWHAFGPNKRFLLGGISGPAAAAKRSGIMIHGGPLNPAYIQWLGMRPTLGCLRLRDEDIASAIKVCEGAEQILENVIEQDEISMAS
jgi:hypothetical protein